MEPRRGRGRSRGRSYGGWIPVLAMLGLAACQGGPKEGSVTPQVVQSEEERLLAPFLVEQQIVTDRLEVTLTQNFYDNLTFSSLLDGVQEETRTPQADGGTIFEMRTNSPRSPLQIWIAETRFYVTQSARVTVLGGVHDLTVRAEASGKVSVVDGDGRRDFGAVRIENGSFRGAEVEPR